MTTTPNYEQLPLGLRIYQEQMFFNDHRGDKPLVISPSTKIEEQEHYYHNLRILTDRLSDPEEKLRKNTIREELADIYAQDPDQFHHLTTAIKATTELPSSGRSPRDIADDGPKRRGAGPQV